MTVSAPSSHLVVHACGPLVKGHRWATMCRHCHLVAIVTMDLDMHRLESVATGICLWPSNEASYALATKSDTLMAQQYKEKATPVDVVYMDMSHQHTATKSNN